jgi:tetratricopeptide (TPR) repeat protein
MRLPRSLARGAEQATALPDLGLIDWRQGRYQPAASQFLQALALFREIGDRADEAEILNGLGEIFLATGPGRACHAAGDTARARRYWQEALTLYASLSTPEADQIRAQLATDCA